MISGLLIVPSSVLSLHVPSSVWPSNKQSAWQSSSSQQEEKRGDRLLSYQKNIEERSCYIFIMVTEL